MVLSVAERLVAVHSTTAVVAAKGPRDSDDIDGMELQDDDGDGRTLESHRSQRHARDEWMAPIGCAGHCTELTLAAPADLGCMRVNWEMAEPMRWCSNSGCALPQRKCSAPNMSEHHQMFCKLGVPARSCASGLYSSGWRVDGVSIKLSKAPDGQLPHH
ncbi:surface protease GP63 [Trypanosoma cruzi]|nr:surface protease GP63 [Trypanosoma cruzi]